MITKADNGKYSRSISREAFKIFDSNHDGMITLKEFKKVTDILGTVLSQEEVDEFMKEADKVLS